jgi:putative phage-type endonuclease
MAATETIVLPSRESWLALRTLGIGSSDAAAVLGISRYKSAFQLYQEKLGLEPISRNERELLTWGNILEEPIAQRYASETGRQVRNPRDGSIDGFAIQRSLDVPFMLSSVDRFTTNPARVDDGEGVLEIKNAHFFVGKTWIETREPPLEFQVQVQHQLAVTGSKWGSIAGLIGGSKFLWADVPRDDEFIELLIKAEADFWQRLKDENPPEPDGSAASTEALNRMFARESSGIIVPLGAALIDAHVELQDAKAREKKAELEKKAAENQIKLAIGEAAGGRLPDGTVYTWKLQNRKEFVTKASSFRVLRVFPAREPLPLPAGRTNLELEGITEEGPDTL